MNIETALLLLESVLLVATIVLLLYSIRESRQRGNLILEVSKATKTLTRTEYFHAVVESIIEAKREVFGCVTGHRSVGTEDEKRTENILNAIEKAVDRGATVRFLLPMFHDRLYMGFLYTKAGAEVRYSTNDIVYSLRYNVVDSRLVVIGIPEIEREEASTSMGHRMPSEALASILRQNFYEYWEKNVTFPEYLKQVMEQTGSSVQRLALETGLKSEELERLLSGT